LHFPKLSLDFGKPFRFSTFHDVTIERNTLVIGLLMRLFLFQLFSR